MPLYEYECQQCHRRTEKIQKFSDPELTVCPFCGGALARTLTAPAVHFAGGGWYKDLYSSAKPATGGEPGTGKSDAPASGSSGEGAATPATSGSPAPAAGSSSTSGTAAPAPAAPAKA